MTEIWKPVDRFPGYEASSLGNVRSVDRHVMSERKGQPWSAFKRGRVLKAYETPYGYLTVQVSDRLRRPVHVLVAEAFLGPRPDGKEVNHIDGDKKNNRIENLEWATKSENTLHRSRVLGKVIGEVHGRATITEDDVRNIRQLLLAGMSSREVANAMNVGRDVIHKISCGKTWRHVDA